MTAPDACRPVVVTVDGQPETVRVHGATEPSAAAVEALGELVAAVRDRMATESVSVRRRALDVLRGHWPESGRCRCGSAAGLNATLWSVHVLRLLAEAGVTVPLDDAAVTT
jgi:hypothetical protein